MVQREALAKAGPNASKYFEYWLKQRTLKKVAYTIIPTGLLVIAPIEKFLRQDPQSASGDSQWSFGQVHNIHVCDVVSGVNIMHTPDFKSRCSSPLGRLSLGCACYFLERTRKLRRT